MSLADWQREFAEALLRGADGSGFREAVEPGKRISPDLALRIYRSNVRGAQTKALRVAYPVMAAVVGDRCFGAMAREFADAAPATEADLNAYGADFSAFVRKLIRKRVAFRALPWLRDLAELEWRLHRAWYAEDDLPFDPRSIELHPDPASLVPVVGASVASMRSTWPVDALWKQHQPGNEPEAVERDGDEIRLVVYRGPEGPEVRRVDALCHELLAACRADRSMRALESHPGLDAGVFSRMIAERWIVGFAGAVSGA